MASHSRSKSKGAFSILSIDTFRSFSRAGSRQGKQLTAPPFHHGTDSEANRTTKVDLTRSPSSLSCNPHDQQPAEPQSPTAATELTGLTLTSDEPKRRRPLSWLSLRGARRLYPRSMSVQLPKDTSCSTMGRSVISAPILTSTTNSKVAAAERVACRDTFGEEHPYETTVTEAHKLADIMVERPTPRHRPSRRFVDVLKNKIRRRERNFTKIEEEPTGNHRRRAETINLCKDKIKNLTGNGYINRKSITESNNNRYSGTEHLLGHKESRAVLLRKTSQAALDFDSQHQPDHDSHFGSLSRSFNPALEKLDFQSNTPFLRSRSSTFNMRKREEKQEAVPGVTPYKPPYTPRPAFAELTSTTTDNNNDAVNNNSGTGASVHNTTTTSTESTTASRMTQQDPAVNQGVVDDKDNKDGRATQLQHTSGGYILARPYPKYPGGVNPLRMHTNVMTMAGQQLDEQDGASEVAEGNLPQNNETETSSALDTDLEGAPIFSPSMGELSQYARTPPAAKTETPALTPSKPAANRLSKRKSGTENDDGGKKDENRSPKMKKSKSFSSLVNIFKRAEAPPMPNRSSSPFMPATHSPLRIVHTAKGDDEKRYGMIGMPSPK